MLLALDSATLYYRAFHSLPESLTAPDGTPHNAVRGFLSTVSRLAAMHRATALAAAWDVDWRPQWRVDLLPQYKAHRVAEEATDEDEPAPDDTPPGREVGMPENLGPQVEGLADLLRAGECPVVGAEDFEADDIVASIAAQQECIVVSGDRDLVQVVDDRVRLHLSVNGGLEKWPLLDPAGVVDRFGVPPTSYVDLAVLRGDPSDGLAGVPGIGAKTATTLLAEYGTVSALLDAARAGAGRPLTPRLSANLLDSSDYLQRALVVATARRDAPLPTTFGVPRDTHEARNIARDWGVERTWSDLCAVFATVGR